MPISITDYDDNWNIHIEDKTALIAQDNKYIIPLSHGCPRCEGKADLYSPMKDQILDHKGEFTMFMINHGYAQYLPTCYSIDYDSIRVVNPVTPNNNDILVVKPVQGRNGQGIRIINGSDNYHAFTECVVSEYIKGDTEYIVTMFCLKGRIVCSKYVSGQFCNEPYIKKRAIEGCRAVNNSLSKQCNICFELIVKDLDYSGIICANFKVCSEGLKIFEMNPRMGSTMIGHRELFNEFIRDIIVSLKLQ
jgi:hypothetical protein